MTITTGLNSTRAIPLDALPGAAILVAEGGDRLLKIAGVGSVLPTLLQESKNTPAAITATVEVLAEEVETWIPGR